MAPEGKGEFRVRALILGWPLLLGVWVYFLWFVSQLLWIISQPVVHRGVSSIDDTWSRVLLPALYVPTIVVFSYCNWLGWKFFRHN